MKRVITTAYLLGLTASLCAHGHGHHHDHEHEEFKWTAEKSAYADIELETAGPGMIQRFSQVSGKIVSHPDHIAYVIPKVEGTVYSIEKNIGDRVEKGEVLAVIESLEVAEAKNHYMRALNLANAKQELLKREESLKGISAAQDYWDAKLASQEAEIELACARETLYALGFTKKEIEHVSEENENRRRFFTLKAPLDGRVLKRNLTLGEHADEETVAFTVGNFERVWVEMHIPQNEVRYVRKGLDVKIASAAGNEEAVRICQFSPTICEETRMAKAVATMRNPSEKWRPGQYVNASIKTKTIELPLVVPREAVQKMKGESYLFVECHDNFEPCKVKLGKMDGEHVEVVSGLHEGDSYVSTNAFCLKADYEKEEVEHSH